MSSLDDISTWNTYSSSQSTVTVIAATNEPWAIGKAFLRSGRLERIIFVGPLDEEGRAAMVKGFLRNLGFDVEIADVHFKSVIMATENYTGADISLLLRRATSQIQLSGHRACLDDVVVILLQCLEAQSPSVASSMLLQYKSWMNYL